MAFEARPLFTDPVDSWRRWFAWYPVRLSYEINESPGYSWVDSGNYAWLRWIEMRLDGGEWQYRR